MCHGNGPRCTRHWPPCLLAVALFAVLGNTAIADPIELSVTPVPLDTADPARTTVGSITYLGGVRLRSSNPSFGGLSGLWVEPTGHRAVAVTDQGAWFTATIAYDENRRLAGLADTAITAMLGIDDLPLLPPWSDAGAIVVSEGRRYVAFERENRLYRYGVPDAPWTVTPEWLPLPEEIAAGPRNGGMEAITDLGDGRLLVFSEGIPRGDGLAAWILEDDVAAKLTLTSKDGFLPTGAATLSNGDVLLLERRFSFLGGFAARIRRISRADIAPGAVLTGEEIATLMPPLTTDNFEALSVVPLIDGGSLVFLLSDDNFSALQRTLLLMFRLSE